jgi:pimeloyl-ACP methyl ester carboxylesterase
LDHLQTPEAPLVLKSQGSFFVGGEQVEQSFDELGSFGPGGKISVNQMYVRYMVPASDETGVPVIMIHGMALTGKTWETTPDGRMGWDEYFVRRGHPTYVIDQVARGRSGFNQALLNNIRTGKADAADMPMARRFADEWVWTNFRMGSGVQEPFEDTQFPTDYLDELSRQGVPDISGILPDYNANYQALSDLAKDLGRAVLMSHSQSGFFPMQSALVNAEGIAGIVSLEPGYCPTNLDENQLKILSGIPILFVFGDNLDVPTGTPHSWKTACEQCESFSEQVNKLGGNARVIRLAEEGIPGNSHMLMQDKNHLELADMVLDWLDNP